MKNKIGPAIQFFIVLVIIGIFILWSRSGNLSKQKEDQKFRTYVVYSKKHPEENETYSILSAKYGIDVSMVQDLLSSFDRMRWHEHNKNVRKIINELSQQFKIPESIIASIYIDHSYLTSECAQPDVN